MNKKSFFTFFAFAAILSTLFLKTNAMQQEKNYDIKISPGDSNDPGKLTLKNAFLHTKKCKIPYQGPVIFSNVKLDTKPGKEGNMTIEDYGIDVDKDLRSNAQILTKNSTINVGRNFVSKGKIIAGNSNINVGKNLVSLRALIANNSTFKVNERFDNRSDIVAKNSIITAGKEFSSTGKITGTNLTINCGEKLTLKNPIDRLILHISDKKDSEATFSIERIDLENSNSYLNAHLPETIDTSEPVKLEGVANTLIIKNKAIKEFVKKILVLSETIRIFFR